MSGYTLRSGIPTVTVSLYCPTCRQRRVFDADRWWALQRSMYVRARWLYCSEDCQTVHTTQLLRDADRHVQIFADDYASLRLRDKLLNGHIPQEISVLLVNSMKKTP